MTPTVAPHIQELITQTCGDNSECAYDIAVTGNVDVGRETLDDIEEHMMIVNLTLPSKVYVTKFSLKQFAILQSKNQVLATYINTDTV